VTLGHTASITATSVAQHDDVGVQHGSCGVQWPHVWLVERKYTGSGCVDNLGYFKHKVGRW
jgi:hypothetical protein